MTKPLWVSPSDLETADLCLRKYWFKKVLKISEIMKGSAALGTGLHGAVERYLRADDLGNDPDGDPVNLYPSGWFIITERDGQTMTLSPAEQELVNKLVEKAIEEGHLVREPGRKVEFKWRLDAPGFEDLVVLNGKIDVLAGAKVTDHKTVKSMRWAKSANELGNSIQMNLYGLVAIHEALKAGEPRPDEVTFSHVAYCKDPEDLRVRTTTKVKPVVEVADFYTAKVSPLLSKMLAVQRTKKWHELPDPDNRAKACNAFGGCSFIPICSGQEKPEEYQNRLLRNLQASVDLSVVNPQKPSSESKEPPVGKLNLLSSLMNRGGSSAPPAAESAPAINQPPPLAPAESAAPAPAAVNPAAAALFGHKKPSAPAPVAAPAANSEPSPLPPWARPDCGACGKSEYPGWNSKGDACRICNNLQAQAGRPQSSWFVIIGSKGNAVWEVRAEYAAMFEALSSGSCAVPGTGGSVKSEVREPIAEAPPSVGSVFADAPAPVFSPLAANAGPIAPAPTPAPEVEEIDGSEGSDGKRKAGRPKVGLTLLIGASVVRTTSTVKPKLFDHVFNQYAGELALQHRARSYYELDAFQRRDQMAAFAAAIAEALGTAWISVSPSALGNPDMKAFLAALRPHAGTIIEALTVN